MTDPVEALDIQPEEGWRRNPAGWICFAILVGFIMISAAAAMFGAKPARLDGHDEEQSLLKQVLSTESFEKSFGMDIAGAGNSYKDTLSKSLDEPIANLVVESDKDIYASMLYAEMRTYQGKPVPVEHMGLLAHSKLPEDRAFYTIYSSDKLTSKQAEDLIAKLPEQPFVYQAARVQAWEKAGVKDAVARIVSPLACIGTALLVLGMWPFIGLSMGIWIVFRRRLREGRMQPKGIPLERITALDADRLAIRAAQIFAIFVFAAVAVILVARAVHLKLTEAEMSAIGGILTILSIFALQAAPIEGKRISLASLGFSGKDLGKDVLLGIAGFFAEFPVALILGAFSVTLLKFLPKPTHPAEIIEHTHDLRTVIPILISACIIAPFWEEVVFRGMLFPGLKKLMGGLVPSMILSSVIFASVHPQGIAEWLPLAFIGATSCYLSYQSRSLVPGMVMHCLHNAMLCVLMLLT